MQNAECRMHACGMRTKQACVRGEGPRELPSPYFKNPPGVKLGIPPRSSEVEKRGLVPPPSSPRRPFPLFFPFPVCGNKNAGHVPHHDELRVAAHFIDVSPQSFSSLSWYLLCVLWVRVRASAWCFCSCCSCSLCEVLFVLVFIGGSVITASIDADVGASSDVIIGNAWSFQESFSRTVLPCG